MKINRVFSEILTLYKKRTKPTADCTHTSRDIEDVFNSINIMMTGKREQQQRGDDNDGDRGDGDGDQRQSSATEGS